VLISYWLGLKCYNQAGVKTNKQERSATMTTIMDGPKYPNTIRQWMRHRGFTTEDLEQRTQIPLRTLKTYLAGGFIRYERREILAEALGCSVEQLMTGDGVAATHLVQYHREQFNTLYTLGSDDMDRKRRELLRLLAVAGAALLVLPLPELDWDRVERAFTKPSRMDASALQELEKINAYCWGIYRSALSKHSVLDGALGHLKSLVQLLQEAHATSTHKRLCGLASDLAQLVGEIFFDLNDHHSAQSCYTFAVAAAREAGHYDLWACALARNAYLPVYEEEFQSAIPLLREARRVALRGDTSLSTQFWVDSIAAEAYAGLRNATACQRALDGSHGVLGFQLVNAPAWVRFEGSRLPALKGGCFVRLGMPDPALPALQEALQLVPSPIRRRAMILTDLALASVQQKEIEQACDYAGEAVEIASHSSSIMLVEGLHKVRYQLEPFSNAYSVRKLDKRLALLS